MTEDQLERETLAWLTDIGYTHRYGPDIAHDGPAPERASYQQALLPFRLREAIHRLNPGIPVAAREDAFKQVTDLGIPALLSANRHFHRLLVSGVPVQYQLDGQTRGDFVRLIDWAQPGHNEFWAANQFTLKGAHHTRRPDIILFVNGLPLVLIELKKPADLNADVWKAYDQIQTYKAQIPDVFQYNEILVISDGTEALLGSLSSSSERFMAWRTIDGQALDPLGEFNELQTLVRGVLAPEYLLDYLRYFVLFEDDGALVKKIACYHQFHAVRSAIGQVVAAARPGGSQKGGVVWHTQGSGKSITMTCFAARVMQESAMGNPTIEFCHDYVKYFATDVFVDRKVELLLESHAQEGRAKNRVVVVTHVARTKRRRREYDLAVQRLVPLDVAGRLHVRSRQGGVIASHRCQQIAHNSQDVRLADRR